MFSTHAFFQNGDFAAADTNLNAVADATTFTEGKVLRVPPGRAMLLAEGLAAAVATFNSARVETPSIRPLANQELSVARLAATFDGMQRIQRHQRSPRELQVAEQMTFQVNTDDAVAQDHYGVVWLGDGPMQPVDGRIFTTRVTAAVAQVSGVWVSGPITFIEALPVTDYQVVGARVVSTSGVIGRLIFSDSQFRPGVPVESAASNQEPADEIRMGKWGVWGQFNINQPPQLEMLGGTAVAQIMYLDLIRVN